MFSIPFIVPLTILGHCETWEKDTLEEILEVGWSACDPLPSKPVGTSGFSSKFANEVQGRRICPTSVVPWKSLSEARLLAINSMLYSASEATR